MFTPLEYLLIALSAVAAGLINALAGGGTLITFPMLTFVGIPGVAASITNTVALSPGYLGATFAQLKDLRGQERRMWVLAPISALGGIIGGVLLLRTGEKLFSDLVPYLILLAALLLAVQDPIRAWVGKRAGANASATRLENLAVLPVGFAAIYGGYFGAGLSV
ncbi:MAG: sulfite exporter TauE/SafE family protein, partial [Anaerolineales bacterium]|nr:sulfite exporter TauE/SafE family protein [Anaerolineales bacterium]